MLALTRTTQFGDVVDDINSVVNRLPGLITQAGAAITQIEPFLPQILTLVQDPAFPDVMARIQTIQTLTDTGPASAGAAPSSGPTGLAKILPLLDGGIFYLKHPSAPFVAAGASVVVLGGIGAFLGFALARRGLGKSLGKRQRRRR